MVNPKEDYISVILTLIFDHKSKNWGQYKFVLLCDTVYFTFWCLPSLCYISNNTHFISRAATDEKKFNGLMKTV